MTEAVIVLKQKQRMRAQRRICRIPVDRIMQINIEVRHHRLSVFRHVSGRRKILLLQILQVANQRLLRIAPRAGIPLDRSLIDHDGKRKSGMILRFSHHQLRSLIDGIPRSIPVDDYAINPAADHVLDLPVNLRRIGRTVAHIHVVRLPKP